MAADRKPKSKKKPSPPATLSEMIAAKNYPEAIEALRAQLAHRPGIQTRLQLADLLLLAGRRDEAMPIFMGLADELAKDGFVAKALAILKRVERLDPGRADVEARLADLARSPSARSALLPPPPAPPKPPPAFGMEEISHEAAAEAPEAVASAEAATPEEIVPVVPPAPEPMAIASPAVIEDEAAPAAAAPKPATEALAPAPERKREVAGLGGIWKRLMTALGPAADSSPAPVPAGEAAPAAAAETSAAMEAPETTAPAETPAAESEIADKPAIHEPAAAVAAPAEEPAPVEAGAETPAEPIAEATPDTPAPAAAAPEEQPAPIAAEAERLEPNAEPIVEAEPETEAVVEIETDTIVEEPAVAAAPESSDVVAKLGGVFKKFLANLPGGEPSAPPAPEPASEATPDQEDLDFAAVLSAAGIDPATANEDEEAFFDSFIDDDDMPPSPAEEAIALPPPATPSSPDLGPTATMPPMPSTSGPRWTSPMNEAGFRDQVLDLIEDVLKRPAEVTPAAPGETTEPIANAYKDELVEHPLFRDLSENEMLAMLRALRLACFDPGEIIVTEGEPGAGLFLLINGTVKVFARNPSGHNLPIGTLSDGTFFGEMSLLSGKPRNATVTATGTVELLELPKPLLDAIAISHPRVRDIVDTLYLQRANSPEMAAVRNVPMGDVRTRERAMQVLKGYFGGRRWEPRMQLKLAMVLLKAGKEDEAVPVLVDLAETLLREGDAAKAIAILKKVEAIRKRSLQVVNLAPLKADEEEADATGIGPPVYTPPARPAWAGRTQAFFSDWLLTARRRSAEAQESPRRIPGYGPELVASPLFEGFSEEELLAFMQGLRLSVYEPGDIIITEGEPGQSVFILTVGSVRVYVRNPTGHDIQVCQLKEGAFFGEMSALSGRPRTASVTATTRCELLEMDRTTLDAIAQTHPRVKQVLEEVYIERASSSTAERIRTTSAPPT